MHLSECFKTFHILTKIFLLVVWEGDGADFWLFSSTFKMLSTSGSQTQNTVQEVFVVSKKIISMELLGKKFIGLDLKSH